MGRPNGRGGADRDDLNQFFLDTILATMATMQWRMKARRFGFRGPWYTVGYLMATTIEKQLGRPALIETLIDPRLFVAKYNEAATMQKAKGGERLPLFSAEILDAVGTKTALDKSGL